MITDEEREIFGLYIDEDKLKGIKPVQNKDGGYCPRCDTMWASPGVCRCDIPYYNTKEGIHETAKLKNIKAWKLGCSCAECNDEFKEVLNKNQVDYLNEKADDRRKIWSDHASSVFETEIWNKAIEAAANVSEINSAANIRKLKR